MKIAAISRHSLPEKIRYKFLSVRGEIFLRILDVKIIKKILSSLFVSVLVNRFHKFDKHAYLDDKLPCPMNVNLTICVALEVGYEISHTEEYGLDCVSYWSAFASGLGMYIFYMTNEGQTLDKLPDFVQKWYAEETQFQSANGYDRFSL